MPIPLPNPPPQGGRGQRRRHLPSANSRFNFSNNRRSFAIPRRDAPEWCVDPSPIEGVGNDPPPEQIFIKIKFRGSTKDLNYSATFGNLQMPIHVIVSGKTRKGATHEKDSTRFGNSRHARPQRGDGPAPGRSPRVG